MALSTLIQRSPNGVLFSDVVNVSGVNTYTDNNGVTPASTLSWRLQNIDEQGNASDYTGVVTIDTYPVAPLNFVAQPISTNEVDLTWLDGNGNRAVTQINRSTDNLNFTNIANVAGGTNIYKDMNRLPNTHYYYKGVAFYKGLLSQTVALADTITLGIPVPQNLVAVAISASSVKLTWQ